MRLKYKLLSGSFYEGCGVCILDTNTNNFYHKVVFQELNTNKLYINMGTNFNPIKIYEEEIEGNNK